MSDATATLAELEAEMMDLAGKIDRISARRKALVDLIAARKRMAAARAKVRALEPLEREALKSALSES